MTHPRSLPVLSAFVAVALLPAMAFAAPTAVELMAEGALLHGQGNHLGALRRWEQAEKLFEKKKDTAGEFDAVLRQAAACQAMGQQKIALGKLTAAEALAGDDQHRLAQLMGARGAVSMFARQAGDAEKLLADSAKLARESRDDALAGTAQYNLGLLRTGTKDFENGREAFGEALRHARNARDEALAARVRKAMADLEFAAGEFAAAESRAGEAVEAATALPDGQEKAFLLMGAGRVLERVYRDGEEHKNALRLRAFKLYGQAAEVADAINDPVSQSYALGFQGAMYEFEKKRPEALALTQRALSIAQQAQAPDSIYRWQWQSARLIAAMGGEGSREAAIQGYRRAVATLQGIRNDVSIRYGNRNAGSSFREVVGGLYSELADQLLQSVDSAPDDAAKQALLREARGTAELLKSAELEDYFQDDCVSLRRELTKNVENIDPKAVVMYIIPLADRTEILVSLPVAEQPQPARRKAGKDKGPAERGRIERFKSPANDDQITEAARKFRLNLEDRATDGYLEEAQQLYQWLIAPAKSLLDRGGYTTLVFVPDGALRTVPMAALHDGKQFLVENYAVAITPGLELMEARKSTEVFQRMLVSGLSESVQGFSALPAVPEELETVAKINKADTVLKDKAFLSNAVASRLEKEEYSIVHLATHGVFASDVRKSFVLTHDNQLTLDDLERLIRPGELRDRPLELLALSACETAAGDDRAALGLAGVAVKAGARSAFATLWFVNDKASSLLVTEFYKEIKNAGQNKAQALQSAQKMLLKDQYFRHPCYWAPYLIIGNWL